jgi:hypothetical protein
MGSSSATVSVNVSLFIDGVIYASSLIEPVVATRTTYYSFGVFKNATFDASQHVINLTWMPETAGTTGFIKYAHLAAIRLSNFPNTYYNESESLEATVATNTWYNKTFNFYTTENAEHLLLYTTHRKAGTSNPIQTRFVNDSTTHEYSRQEARDATDYWSYFWFTKATLTVGSHTDIVQYSIPSGTPANFAVGFMRTISIQLVETTPPTYSLNSTNSTLAGMPVNHSLYWDDNEGLSHAIFSFDNCTGNLQNISTMSLNGANSWSNFTVTTNSTAACTIRWCVYANDTSNNWNGTSCQNPFSYTTTSGAACSVATGLSNALADGIVFSSVSQGQTKDALGNNGELATDYYVTVQISGCSPSYVDVYMKANNFTNGSYSIDISNEKFRNSTTGTVPPTLTNVSLSTNWILAGDNLADSEKIYLKYLLGVPSAQKAGNYNNTVNIWGGRNDLIPT